MYPPPALQRVAISKDDNQSILKFVLGITASPIGAWYLRTKYAIYDRLHPWYTKKQLEDFPVPEYSPPIVELVDKLIAVCESEAQAKTEQDRKQKKLQKQTLQDELNKAVFDAYGLSHEQRAQIYSSL